MEIVYFETQRSLNFFVECSISGLKVTIARQSLVN